MRKGRLETFSDGVIAIAVAGIAACGTGGTRQPAPAPPEPAGAPGEPAISWRTRLDGLLLMIARRDGTARWLGPPQDPADAAPVRLLADAMARLTPRSPALTWPRSGGPDSIVIEPASVHDLWPRGVPRYEGIRREEYDRFVNSARATLLSARFQPGRIGRRAVRVRVEIPFNFTTNPSTTP